MRYLYFTGLFTVHANLYLHPNNIVLFTPIRLSDYLFYFYIVNIHYENCITYNTVIKIKLLHCEQVEQRQLLNIVVKVIFQTFHVSCFSSVIGLGLVLVELNNFIVCGV